MPITTVDSYLPTMDEFINHWNSVNDVLGTPGLTLQGNYSLASFTSDRTNLGAAFSDLLDAETVQTQAAGTRDAAKDAVRLFVTQFRAAVKAKLPGTPYDLALPTMPQMTTVQSRYLRPLDDISSLWNTINTATPPPGFTPPLTLANGFALSGFGTLVQDLRDAYAASGAADQSATLLRVQRDGNLPYLKGRMVQYRQAVVAAFQPGSPYIASLPAVTPTPGTTPQPVAASGVWAPVVAKAALTWTPSMSPKLSHYSVRTAPGSVYKVKNETVVANLPAGTHGVDTEAGLASPGATALYKVYVVTMQGRRRGSSVVSVTRPG